MGDEVRTAARALWLCIDTILWLHWGRADRYWSWAVITALSLALSAYLVWRGDAFAMVFPSGWTELWLGCTLALVPIRKKWGWPRA
jgi:hypothetical protein